MNEKVAIIDSGIGGLTVLNHILDNHPDAHITYVADNKYFPYGVKKDYQLVDLIDRIIHHFVQLDYGTIILACNTASYIYNKYLKYRYHDRVYSIIESTITDLIEQDTCKKVALIATNNTIQSEIYQNEINKVLKVNLYPYESSELVELCEAYQIEEIKKYIETHFQTYKENNIDTLILGCTHFNAIEPILSDFFGKDVRIICSGYSLVETKSQVNLSSSNNESCIYLTNYYEDYMKKIRNLFPILKNIEIKELNI